MKLNIQLFGGRGASSSNGNRLSININGSNKTIKWADLKPGDTFEVEGNGETYTLSINSNYITNTGGRPTSGTSDKGGSYMTMLVRDEIYNRADQTSKLYMTPLSKTKNWRRK